MSKELKLETRERGVTRVQKWDVSGEAIHSIRGLFGDETEILVIGRDPYLYCRAWCIKNEKIGIVLDIDADLVLVSWIPEYRLLSDGMEWSEEKSWIPRSDLSFNDFPNSELPRAVRRYQEDKLVRSIEEMFSEDVMYDRVKILDLIRGAHILNTSVSR